MQDYAFNPTTTIRFSLAGAHHVSLRIYDVSGRLIRNLVSDVYPKGRHQVRWDVKTDRGEGAASGVYFYRLSVPGYEHTKKMVLLR